MDCQGGAEKDGGTCLIEVLFGLRVAGEKLSMPLLSDFMKTNSWAMLRGQRTTGIVVYLKSLTPEWDMNFGVMGHHIYNVIIAPTYSYSTIASRG